MNFEISNNINMNNPWIITIATSLITLFGIYLSYRGIIKQILNNPKQLIMCKKEIKSILTNLNLIIQAAGYGGNFIPNIEPTAKTLTFSDTKKTGEISLAVRQFEIRKIFEKIQWACFEFMTLINKNEIPKTYAIVNDIYSYIKNYEKIIPSITQEWAAGNKDLDGETASTRYSDASEKRNELKDKLKSLKEKLDKTAIKELSEFKNK